MTAQGPCQSAALIRHQLPWQLPSGQVTRLDSRNGGHDGSKQMVRPAFKPLVQPLAHMISCCCSFLALSQHHMLFRVYCLVFTYRKL